MNSQLGQILCSLSDGMFDNEYAVEIEIASGEKVSLFADKQLVQINGSKNSGYLQVNIIDNVIGKDKVTVLLPSEALEKATRWVQVPQGHVQRA